MGDSSKIFNQTLTFLKIFKGNEIVPLLFSNNYFNFCNFRIHPKNFILKLLHYRFLPQLNYLASHLGSSILQVSPHDKCAVKSEKKYMKLILFMLIEMRERKVYQFGHFSNEEVSVSEG